MHQYQALVENILKDGTDRTDRTGVGTRSIFGYQMRFDLTKGFPMVTTKRVPFGLIKSELLWFLKGDTNIRYLLEHNNHIWDEWAFKNWVESEEYTGPDMTDFGLRAVSDPDFKAIYDQEMATFQQRVLTDEAFANQYGDLGNIYGKQWRAWKKRDGGTLDQIQQVIDQIKKQSDSRRLIVSAWNPEDIPSMSLPPCHTLFQFYVSEGKLSCQLYQRSADVFLGVPFNIASYALLVHLIARETDLQVGEFIHTFGDAHLYSNHFEQAEILLSREPRPLPELVIQSDKPMIDLSPEDIQLIGYQPHKTIKAPIAV